MDTPQIDDLLIWLGGVAAALIAIVAAIALGKRYLLGDLLKDIDDVRKELRPNGGGSVRDAIDRIAEKQGEIQHDVRELRQRLDDHITWHLQKESK